ncbi:conserved hypothetical protein [Culex quinquefasciatus]|uniref:Salivary secreted protein n=1 Tax=Culex quinquefasciatus TaxID=7176 RepID=B0XLS3_CULQU|nr:conserved hypothetical protein [Culex quinquefasciatus]|eukprot:XP_001870594.1 conserved hypothetical protein [Culex quinquefasciatus]
MMVKLKILGLVVFLQLIHSIPSEYISKETSELAELNRLFNQRHREIDYKLRLYRMQYSLAVKNLNAQLISRNGFVMSDIQHMKQHAKETILEHALDTIGDPQNPCIVAANDEAIRRATQAARDLSVVAERTYGSLSIFTLILVRPNIDMFQFISTTFQIVVLDQLAHRNAVTDLQDVLAGLAALYLDTVTFLDFVVISLDNQLDFFQTFMNTLRRDAFKSIDGIARDYIFNMEQLIEEARQCS